MLIWGSGALNGRRLTNPTTHASNMEPKQCSTCPGQLKILFACRPRHTTKHRATRQSRGTARVGQARPRPPLLQRALNHNGAPQSVTVPTDTRAGGPPCGTPIRNGRLERSPTTHLSTLFGLMLHSRLLGNRAPPRPDSTHRPASPFHGMVRRPTVCPWQNPSSPKWARRVRITREQSDPARGYRNVLILIY